MRSGGGLIEHSQAQPVNIPHAPPPPVVNPSSPNTVQPSYTPSTPSTRSTVPGAEVTSPTVPSADVTPPAKEEPSSTTTRSERRAKTCSVLHYHRARSIGVGPSLGSFDCSYGWCFVFLLRTPITGHMVGIAIEARRIAFNVAKLRGLVRRT